MKSLPSPPALLAPRLTYLEPLAPLTTLHLGGPARALVRATTAAEVAAAHDWAHGAGLPLAVLGGGSNLVVHDAGFPGVVLLPALRGLATTELGAGVVRLEVAAGEPWGQVVAAAVAENLAGIECLAGIPGSAGAAPVQNIGAYGQEVAEVLEAVQVYHRGSGAVTWLAAAECGFGYRHSRFKAEPETWVVLGLRLRLVRGGPPTVRYPELRARLAAGPANPDLATVAQAVLALRRAKSMVYDPSDPNHRSAGSFFMNPVLTESEADAVAGRVTAAGLEAGRMPRYSAEAGQAKLSAAWLVERAGFNRGVGAGAVGLSSRHTLALVNRGGARTADLIDFARTVQRGVWRAFGVWLRPEPVPLGFPEPLPRGFAEAPAPPGPNALGLWGDPPNG